MSGGRLVVLDRLGRDVKQYPLPSGLATLGRDHNCDIRIMLPTVSPHHATVVVHTNQTVVRNVSESETLVNGESVSVAALRHGDLISIGERALRWEYDQPDRPRPLQPQPALHVRRRMPRTPRRASAATGAALQHALQLHHRASMPGNAGGKQVAIVQPQRRDTSDQRINVLPTTVTSPRQTQNKRPRNSKNENQDPTTPAESDSDRSARKSTLRISPKTLALQNTTKATLWIESRKSSPRKSVKVQTPTQVAVARKAASTKKSTPLRMAVLRKVQSAQKMRVMKIAAPVKIDQTKQAALLLMTGHTPKSKLLNPKQDSSKNMPRLVVTKPSPVRRTPRSKGRSTLTPNTSRRSSKRTSGGQSVSVLEITDSDPQNSITTDSIVSRQSRMSALGSPILPSPKKSALKDPSAKKSMRKTESIKFDLSNLENYNQNESDNVLTVTGTTINKTHPTESILEDNLTLHYSDNSSTKSPSPRRSIHSRSNRILGKLGVSITESLSLNRSTLTPESPRARKSLRGSIILQKSLETSDNGKNTTAYSRKSTKTLTDQSYDTTATSFKTRTLSPRTSNQNLESYSIVDLVSIDSNESDKSTSVYGSVGSTRSSSIVFGTPQNTTSRRTRSTIDPNLLGSSTPYITGNQAKRSLSNPSKTTPDKSTRTSSSTRRSKSLTTPENTQKHISVNSTRISRASRSRSRINDTDLQYTSTIIESEAGASPKSSRKSFRPERTNRSSHVSNASKSKRVSPRTNLTLDTTAANSSQDEGTITPENRYSPEEATTPVLSIQSLLDSSQSSLASQSSQKRASGNIKRKTIGLLRTQEKGTGRSSMRSLNISNRKSLRSRRSRKESLADSDKTDENALNPDNEETVTPKGSVTLVQEAVKNKHSTAKKPQSKRSIIDNLNESDIVKQLFNSPVKRKLSQSMTEFSRKQLFEDDDTAPRRPTRNTIALTGQTPDISLLENTDRFTGEEFVSPLGTPTNSPNLSGVKRLFRKNTPENDLRNVKGVKSLLRTPRTRRSIKNDLSNVSGVKKVFAKSPKNRLSDVRVKALFAGEPKNDIKRVSGVKSLFQLQNEAKNDLSDVRGVRSLFKRKSAVNDLRNVSGVKRTLRVKSPKNDLRDVRGVKGMFQQRSLDDSDLSGIEELFDISTTSHHADNVPRDPEKLFDQLIGKPPVKAVYSKSFINNRSQKRKNTRMAKSFHAPIDVITYNVEDWVQQELNKLVHKKKETGKSLNVSNSVNANVSRELQKLATDTLEGTAPIRASRARNSTLIKSHLDVTERKKSASEIYGAHTLPIKKRSLVEASMEKSRNDTKLNVLPIKKRAVVHSTPVKGRYNLTMNASELGRVSPIAVIDKTRLDNDTTDRSVHGKIKGTPKNKRGTAKMISIEIVEPKQQELPKSPKIGRGNTKLNKVDEHRESGKETEKSPKRVKKDTRSKNIEVLASPKTKRRRTAKSEIITEDQKTQLELPRTRRTRNNTDKQESSAKFSAKQKKSIKGNTAVDKTPKSPKSSPKKTRAKAKLQTPNKTNTRSDNVQVNNTKKRRVSLVITKKPPVMSPKPATKTTRSNKKVSVLEESPKKVVMTRRQKAEPTVEKPKTPKSTRAKVSKSSVVLVKPSPKLKPQAKAKGKKETTAQTPSTKQSEKSESNKKESPKKSQPEPVKRTRKAIENEEKFENQSKRSRSTRVTAQSSVDSKTRSKKVESQESVQSEPTTRTRRTKANDMVIPDLQKSRKRKQADEAVVSSKMPKSEARSTRAKKVEIEVEPKNKSAAKGKSKTNKNKDISGGDGKRTRSQISAIEPTGKADNTVQKNKPARGKKATVIESAPQTGGRKRKSAASASPAKEPAKKSRAGGSRSRPRSPSGGRNTRTKLNTNAEAGAGAVRRSRRR